jgi:hypothetical protein
MYVSATMTTQAWMAVHASIGDCNSVICYVDGYNCSGQAAIDAWPAYEYIINTNTCKEDPQALGFAAQSFEYSTLILP